MNKNHIVIIIGIIICIFIPVLVTSGKIYDYFKQKTIEQHNIVCSQCKGTGEYPIDVNKLTMEASLTLFINHHLMVDKCERCVKLKSGDGYAYCDIINDRYTILLQEYGAAGRKIEVWDCPHCLGCGQFAALKPNGDYYSQKEYDEKYKKN